MGCDGSGQTNLTNNSADDRQPSWASGGKLAFSSDRRSTDIFDIYLLTINPWGIERLTTNAANDESPALSPDGSKVAFVSYRDDDKGDIYVLDISSNSITRLTDDDEADLDPAWSPDGAKIAFASDRGGNFDIYKLNADGTGSPAKVAAVSHGTGNDRSPALGEYFGDEVVAFASDRDGDWEVYVYDDIDGFRAITEDIEGESDFSPSWGPSGDELVFDTNRDTNGNYEVYRADDSFGDSRTNITEYGNSASSDSDETYPDWEPVAGDGYCPKPSS